jgi:hypothetical protein
MIDTRTYGASAHHIQEEEERSINTAMRATLWFVTIVLLLAWAGVADAGSLPGATVAAVAARAG